MKNSLLESELEQKVKLLEEALKKKKETITAEKDKLKLVKGQLYLEDIYVGDDAAFLAFHAKLQEQRKYQFPEDGKYVKVDKQNKIEDDGEREAPA